jgi:hypothetical protein
MTLTEAYLMKGGQNSASYQAELLIAENVRLARNRREELSTTALKQLRILTRSYGFSLALGDLLYLQNSWYVVHAGLLRLAARKHCSGIQVEQVAEACDPPSSRWVFRATVYKSPSSRGFVGYGDAEPSNVSQLVRGAEMRVAETRAVNRALRKAYGIGLCSVEELDRFAESSGITTFRNAAAASQTHGGSNNGQPRLRDQLCLLIRQYNLDPKLVKAYAADFCGTKTLREANRDSVERFISLLSQSAKQNRDSLVCKLNSYAQTQEVNS